MDWLAAAIADAEGRGYRFDLRPPSQHIELCEDALEASIPASYRRFLAQHDGGSLFIQEGTHATTVELLATDPDVRSLADATLILRDTWGPLAEGLVIMAYTPGPGAFYLAMDAVGQIIDLFGLPTRDKLDPRWPQFRGEWRIVAPSLEAWLQRMFEEPTPLFWV